ncbi:AAA family ATPase [Sphingomonas sp. AR_OL41]|nr:AAA family ATPase [Sphingomonas sp. AR_OL41]
MEFNKDDWLEEHLDNPFCRSLGPLPSFAQLHGQMLVQPKEGQDDRLLKPHLRRTAVLRLFRLMVPTVRQVELGERIHQAVRLGYQHRNPKDGHYRRSHHATASALRAFQTGATVDEATSLIFTDPDIVAPGITLVGGPGMGKTRSTNRIIRTLSQPVRPDIEEYVLQLPIVKAECPSRGGRAALCFGIASALDKALGTSYHAELEKGRVTGDHLMLRVQHLLNLHAVGLLIIDEIQHLQQSTEGIRPIMNFLVTLVNVLGIPVMLIGTNEAHEVIQSSFREARRAVGIAQPNWNSMQADEDWEAWLGDVWKYQYTRTPVELTNALCALVHELSQGVIDIAIKLYAMAQMRAITEGGDELLTEDLFRQVAEEELVCVAPMLEALRTGNLKALAQFPDLKPLSHHVADVLARATGQSLDRVEKIMAMRENMEGKTTSERDDPGENVKAYYVGEGHDVSFVSWAFSQATIELGDVAWMKIGLRMGEILASGEAPVQEMPAAPTSMPTVDAPARRTRDGSSSKARPKAKHPASGLLAIVDGADDPHAALKAAGVVTSPAAIIGTA